MKARNGEAEVDILDGLPLEVQQAFEVVYLDATKHHASDTLRQVLRKAGRRYAAAGWRLAYEYFLENALVQGSAQSNGVAQPRKRRVPRSVAAGAS